MRDTEIARLIRSRIDIQAGASRARRGGLSLTGLGKACGVSRNAASYWASGQTRPDMKYLRAIAGYIDVDFATLLRAYFVDQNVTASDSTGAKAVPPGDSHFAEVDDEMASAADRIIARLDALLENQAMSQQRVEALLQRLLVERDATRQRDRDDPGQELSAKTSKLPRKLSS